ncbi:NAD(P)H-dependent glycerol-3-phosphate dehydrogenase [candidate division CSSED10-310 bacterium]|uniref:Glycerol-3-phosphate dehydrogenase [NAD(P)+] n=1 Tax=candidate division CSSED10-310 bacterium TaxID=2855610 RepID=A0ABV6YXI0_UNCC1
MGLLDRKIAVIGAGSWGTAITILLAAKGFRVSLWVYEPELLQTMKQKPENQLYFPGFPIEGKVDFSGDISEVVRGSGFIILVVPSHVLRQTLSTFKADIENDSIIVSATKGIEVQTLKRMTEVIGELVPQALQQRIAVLSGPSFAQEVAQKSPTTVVVASENEQVAQQVQLLFNTPHFRTYTNTDVVGVEIGGSLKNVIAIAAGTSDGLGFGNNTKAAILTRGLSEMTRLGAAMGANPLTFAGLSGMGDLILTCNSSLSRNYMTGYKLGKGSSLQEITASLRTVAEGINTTRSAYKLSHQVQVEMPIVDQVFSLLFEGKRPSLAVVELMKRKLKKEHRQIISLITKNKKSEK